MTGGSALRPGYRADIDGLRAISILLVVAFHSGVDRFAGGYVGVDVFFVLSGFLITGLLLGEQERSSRISLRNFYARRIRRLLPLAFLTIVATLAGGLALVAPLRRVEVAGDAMASSLYFANWRFAVQSVAYSDGEVTESLFLHFWSLSVEEQFYVVWPLLIMGAALLARRTGRRFRPTVGVVLAVVSGASFLISIVASYQSADAYYFTHTRVWELGVGAGLALFLPRLRELNRWTAEAAAGLGVLMIVAAALTFDGATAFPGYAAALPVLGCALVVVAGASNRPTVTRLLSLDPMTYVGRLSYGWYLWHWPAIGLAGLVAQRSGSQGGLWVVGALAISFAVAAVTHVLVEEPVRRSRRLAARPAMALTIGLLLTTTPALVAASIPSESEAVVASAPTGPDDGVAEAEGSLEEQPHPVPMTPAEASADEVELLPKGCHSRIPDVEAPDGCVLGATDGELTVLVLGDSHAQHWLPALDQVGIDRGWRVVAWTKSSCTPIDVTLHSSQLKREYRECTEWRQRTLDHSKSIGAIDLVVIADSGRYAGSLLIDGDPVSESQIGEVWEAGAERTFRAYSEFASHVVLLRDTPWAHRRIPECLSEDPSNPDRCSFSLEGRVWLDEKFLQAELAAGGDFVTPVDMTEWVCESDPCHVVTANGLIKYRDSHHLTATFSRSLAEPLGDALQQVLDGRVVRSAQR